MIIYVEDCQMQSALFSHVLERKGHETTLFTSEKELFRFLEKLHFKPEETNKIILDKSCIDNLQETITKLRKLVNCEIIIYSAGVSEETIKQIKRKI